MGQHQLFTVWDKVTQKIVPNSVYSAGGQFISGFLSDANGKLYEISINGVVAARERFEVRIDETEKM